MTHHLDPVPIRVQDERDVPHLPVRETLFEWHAERLEARARRLDVGHGERDVAESARLGIARVIGRRVERLRAVVVGELEDACLKERTTTDNVRSHSRYKKDVGSITFAVTKALFLLGVCGLASGVIKGEEVERKVAKFKFYSWAMATGVR
jgi:hypothetical protein